VVGSMCHSMTKYKVTFYNDMGHLVTEPWITKLPRHIYEFACNHLLGKYYYATDLKGLGCTFYILRDGLATTWEHSVGEDIVEIDYSRLDKFDPSCMKTR
jgi:hypothetical protein